MTPAGFEGLRTDQGPPLAVPLGFFFVATVAMGGAGVVLASGAPVLAARALPGALVLTHLVTLGWLGSIMLGALYQVVPVLAGRAVPWPRLAHGVLGAWALGVAALVRGFWTGEPLAFGVALTLLVAALVGFAAPVGWALLRAPAETPTVQGLRLAVGGLAVTATLGVLLALPRAGVAGPGGDLTGRLVSHAGVGAVGWVGLLVAAVGWQVLPMFYLAPEPSRAATRTTLGATGVSVGGVVVLQAAGAPLGIVTLALIPAAVATLGMQPIRSIVALRARKRRRADASLELWFAGLGAAGLGLALAPLAALSADPRAPVALGWTLGVGFAGLVTHGMVCRIVPFLVWFHRFSGLVGRVPVPTMKGLLPDARVRVGAALHAAAFAVGLGAIGAGSALAGRAAGVLLGASAVALAVNLARVARTRVDSEGVPPR